MQALNLYHKAAMGRRIPLRTGSWALRCRKWVQDELGFVHVVGDRWRHAAGDIVLDPAKELWAKDKHVLREAWR
eukprot:5035583-Prorocentrum_lima.AAC.1